MALSKISSSNFIKYIVYMGEKSLLRACLWICFSNSLALQDLVQLTDRDLYGCLKESIFFAQYVKTQPKGYFQKHCDKVSLAMVNWYLKRMIFFDR